MSLANDLVRTSRPTAIKKRDGRITNQHGVVFFMNDGSKTTKNKLAAHYGIPRSQIQKIYNENNKNYLLANAAIELLASQS
tara:strand:+ start:6226 stop:6468 length:243 start_codon:yes stop_codon:yes gene_type:complete